jgi:hypothetical protein
MPRRPMHPLNWHLDKRSTSLNDLKRDMAILATSGEDWTERTKRLLFRRSVPKTVPRRLVAFRVQCMNIAGQRKMMGRR